MKSNGAHHFHNMMAKNLRQSIVRSIGRFIAIAVIIALGAGMFVGLRMTKTDMVATGQVYTDAQNMFDLRLISSYGWDQEQVDKIAQLDGVVDAEGIYYSDLIVSAAGGEDAVYRFYTLPEEINQLVLLGGRMPESADECLADGYRNDESVIGTTVTVSDSNDEDTLDTLNCRTFTVVGYVSTPLYMDTSRGSTSVGNGSITNYFYVPDEAFDVDYYTEVHVTIPGDYDIYSDEYNTALEDAADAMEPQAEQIAKERYDSLLADAKDEYLDGITEYMDGFQEYRDGKREAEQELHDGYQELLDAEDTLRSSQYQLEKGQKQIDDAKYTLQQNRATLNESRQTLSDSKTETYAKIADARTELQENYDTVSANLETVNAQITAIHNQIDPLMTQIENADAAVTAAQSAYNEAVAAETQAQTAYNEADAAVTAAQNAYNEANQAYNDALADENKTEEQRAALKTEVDKAYNNLTTAQNALTEAQVSLTAATTAKTEAYAALTSAQQTYEYIYNTYYTPNQAQIEEAQAALAQLEAAKSQLESALAQIEAGQQTLDEQETSADAQFAAAEAELADAEEQLDAAASTLYSNQKQIDDGYAELEDGIEQLHEARQEYKDAKAEAKQELADAAADLADAWEELQDAKATIDDMTWDGITILDRNSNIGYSSLDSSSDIVEGVSQIFPAFFLAVAALVCITTMTRMVEEERTQIGTLKALGYDNRAIISKYLVYAGSSALLGCGLGVLVGSVAFPKILWEAYKIMVFIKPDIELRMDWVLCVSVVLMYTITMLLVTWYCCRRSLEEVPAELIRPKAPTAGKQLMFEKLPIWKRVSFLNKVTIRNIFRYHQRLAMMLLGVGGCTALLLTGFGIRDTIVPIAKTHYEEIALYDVMVYFSDGQTQEQQAAFQSDLASGESAMFFYQTSVELDGKDSTKDIYLIAADDEIMQFQNFTDGGKALSFPQEGEALLSVGVAEMLDIQAGDTITLRDSDMRELTLTVSGVYDNYVYNYAIVGFDTLQSQWDETPSVQMAYVAIANGEDPYVVGADLAGFDGVMNVQVNEEIASMVSGMMEALDLVVMVIVVCAGILAAVVLYNLTNINIKERLREIATIKVLGFTATETALYVFKENLALSVMGMVLGLPMGVLLLDFVVDKIRIDFVWFNARLLPASYGLAMALTLLIAVLVDIIFYFRLEKINMAEALKSVE